MSLNSLGALSGRVKSSDHKSWTYRRHRDDTHDDWQRRYDEWHDALRASGWKVEYDRMSREELVALGWKGVDIYRKDG